MVKTVSRVLTGLWIPLIFISVTSIFNLDVERLENPARDMFFARRLETKALKTTAIVAIDDATLERYGWPLRLNLRHYAELVRILSAQGASVIAFDFAFFLVDDRDPGQYDEFAAACREAGNVVLGAYLTRNEKDGSDKIRLPLPKLMEAARAIGVLYHPLDGDSVVRRAALSFPVEGRTFYSLAMCAYMIREDISPSDVKCRDDRIEIQYGPTKRLSIPLDNRATVLVRYAGPDGTVGRYRFIDVLDGKIPPGEFADRAVFVGPTAKILQDFRQVPTASHEKGSSNTMSGVEIHAQTFLSLLEGLRTSGRILIPLSPFNTFLLLVACGLLTAGATMLADMRFSWLAPLVVLFIYFVFSYSYVFLGLCFFPPLASPLLIVFLVYLAVLISRYVDEHNKRRQVRTMFEHFVPSHVVQRLERDPSLLQAFSRKTELSVLFCDIRDFTSIAERIGTEKTVALLNRYFDIMTQVILAHDGWCDKYIGDAILAVFGEPVSSGDHAGQAVKAALSMRKALAELNADKGFRSLLQSDKALDNGIAVNTGEMIVGNLGAARRKNYTVIGDSVNLCSRLETMAKGDNPRIIISQATYDRTHDMIETIPLGEVKVKGREAPVVVYGVVEQAENE